MTKLPIVLAIVVGLVVSASGDPLLLTTQIQQTLTQLDALPSRAQIDDAHESEPALDNLSLIILDDTVDVGLQIRAVRAIAQYCDAPCIDASEAHVTLTTL